LDDLIVYDLSLSKQFSGALEKGGVGALELVAMDMKARLELLELLNDPALTCMCTVLT
jgi:hypothetical protein